MTSTNQSARDSRGGSFHRLPLQAAAVIAARTRFFLLIGAMLGIIAAWPFLQNLWDKLTGHPAPTTAVSANTEYWCPMCPGVVSDWPSKCPVCSMTLVRREKSTMSPRPDGVIDRVQLSPYRIQLAGIRTSRVEYRKLEHEITVGGLLEKVSESTSALIFTGELFDRDCRALAEGLAGNAECDASPGEPAKCRIVEIRPAGTAGGTSQVKIRVENPDGEFRPGTYALARFQIPVSRLESYRRLELQRSSEEAAVGAISPFAGSFQSLLNVGIRQAFAREGQVLCVPESAVIDTGRLKVVYVESMAGMYDAVEVQLGRRYGDYYPVRAGLLPGQWVATAGAVLLDAETRLNPGVAASYFGAGPQSPTPHHSAPAGSPSAADDKELIAKQKICPVTGKALGSMGAPVKVIVDGRPVFICCDGCEDRLQEKKALYLQKLPK
ncbi:MAG TPA: heavy metal-binding domain-containing protein [Gemmata sp.]|nr:heavy metal-binding domain-containing protein [Gemmata sp.]